MEKEKERGEGNGTGANPETHAASLPVPPNTSHATEREKPTSKTTGKSRMLSKVS